MTKKTSNRAKSQRQRSAQCGMSIIEVVSAMTVLAIGVLGSLTMLLLGMQTNSKNRTDTTATVLDQEIVEKFSTLKQYPKSGYVTIFDCAPSSTNDAHEASLVAGASPLGSGATVYTTSTAPSSVQVGDIDWTQAAPTLATSTVQGYAMRYQTCSGDIYEVRWNVMQINTRVSLLAVSSRQLSALVASANGAANQAVLYAPPANLKTLIEN